MPTTKRTFTSMAHPQVCFETWTAIIGPGEPRGNGRRAGSALADSGALPERGPLLGPLDATPARGIQQIPVSQHHADHVRATVVDQRHGGGIHTRSVELGARHAAAAPLRVLHRD